MSYLRPKHRGPREPLEVVYHTLLWWSVWAGVAFALFLLYVWAKQ